MEVRHLIPPVINLLVILAASVVQCQMNLTSIRLWREGSSSSSYTSGIVHVYLDDKWGTVCDLNRNGWGAKVAEVACHQLGFVGAASSTIMNSTDLMFEPIMQNVLCSSSDLLVISQCDYSTTISPTCNGRSVHLTCNSARIWDNPYDGQVRLTGGGTVNEGRLDVYCNGQWGTVCDDDKFEKTEADTVCRQLGYTNAFEYGHLPISGTTSQKIRLGNLDCSSKNMCLLKCSSCSTTHKCEHNEYITIECTFTKDGNIDQPPVQITDCSPNHSVSLIIAASVAASMLLCCSVCLIIYCIGDKRRKSFNSLTISGNRSTINQQNVNGHQKVSSTPPQTATLSRPEPKFTEASSPPPFEECAKYPTLQDSSQHSIPLNTLASLPATPAITDSHNTVPSPE